MVSSKIRRLATERTTGMAPRSGRMYSAIGFIAPRGRLGKRHQAILNQIKQAAGVKKSTHAHAG